ncbi:adenosylcobinamide amidohydrolase [Pseudalkalibacillus sp. SCS-8]|uniref:adenosylcobinamide amidohydrolase n=1 Tax=Pseudalkalibacillus nanhaiensis TaxID=3115291 RepID=UPI0032DA5B62
MLSVQKITGGYAGGDSVIENVTFDVQKGEMFGILGPNGSGKTTLLKMISGLLPVSYGSVSINGKPVNQYSRKELARIIAVLPQHSNESFSYSVKDTVSLGRYAHQNGWFQSWTVHDEEIVQRVMEQTGVRHFQEKDIQALSGGEKQRVFLAQALAQEPEILLLDEPTNHLDLSFQKELLDALREWTIERGMTVISIFHDLNLAGLYCDELLLLEKGQMNIKHKPNEVLKEDRIQSVYKTKIQKQPHPRVPAPQLVLLPESSIERDIDPPINSSLLNVSSEKIVLQSPYPLKTLSSGVIGSGTGWHDTFVNRRVGMDYDCSDHRTEMTDYLRMNGYEPSECVGMMTAVQLEDLSYLFVEEESFSVFAVVTAGVGHAIDASRGTDHAYNLQPGTINTWIFINGQLTEEAFIQSMMTATEVKTKVLHDLEVKDPVSGTYATGTATDSILIAATQRGKEIPFAGTITPLGKVISKAVYECTSKAIQNYFKRKLQVN